MLKNHVQFDSSNYSCITTIENNYLEFFIVFNIYKPVLKKKEETVYLLSLFNFIILIEQKKKFLKVIVQFNPINNS